MPRCSLYERLQVLFRSVFSRRRSFGRQEYKRVLGMDCREQGSHAQETSRMGTARVKNEEKTEQ